MRVLAALLMLIVAGLGTAAGQQSPFVGGWRAETNLLGAPALVEMVFQPDGQFSQQTTTPGTLITIWGTYRVFPAEQILRLDIRGYEPREWCGPLGCQPILMPDGETHRFRFEGTNQLILQNASFGGPPIVYLRTL